MSFKRHDYVCKTEELNPLYEFFKYETAKRWEKMLNLVNDVKQERKGLSDFTRDM